MAWIHRVSAVSCLTRRTVTCESTIYSPGELNMQLRPIVPIPVEFNKTSPGMAEAFHVRVARHEVVPESCRSPSPAHSVAQLRVQNSDPRIVASNRGAELHK